MRKLNYINSKWRKYSLWPLLFSIVMHLIFLSITSDFFFFINKKSKKAVEISIFKKEKVLKDIKHQNELAIDKRVRSEKLKVRIKNKQIVNNESFETNEKPKNPKFLGEKDISVNRQTVAKRLGSFKKSGKGINRELKQMAGNNLKSHLNRRDNILENSSRSKGSNKQGETYSKHASKKLLNKKDLVLSDLGIMSSPILNKVKQEISKDEYNLNKKEKTNQFKLNAGLKDGSINSLGFAQNNDFIEDVPLGDITSLNTAEFKYYGFYNRIRKKLEQYWSLSLKEKAGRIYKRGRNLSQGQDYITSLIVTIDKKGNITQIRVAGPSGYSELDEAAIEAFNKAGPFPNPPSGMFKDGHATLEWGFVVKS